MAVIHHDYGILATATIRTLNEPSCSELRGNNSALTSLAEHDNFCIEKETRPKVFLLFITSLKIFGKEGEKKPSFKPPPLKGIILERALFSSSPASGTVTAVTIAPMKSLVIRTIQPNTAPENQLAISIASVACAPQTVGVVLSGEALMCRYASIPIFYSST